MYGGLVFFQSAQERVIMGFCELGHPANLGLGDFVRVDAGNAVALVMDGEHDAHCVLLGLAKDRLQNVHHEFHRGEIVVV